MKVCILSVQVPFITGGAELHAESRFKQELSSVDVKRKRADPIQMVSTGAAT